MMQQFLGSTLHLGFQPGLQDLFRSDLEQDCLLQSQIVFNLFDTNNHKIQTFDLKLPTTLAKCQYFELKIFLLVYRVNKQKQSSNTKLISSLPSSSMGPSHSKISYATSLSCPGAVTGGNTRNFVMGPGAQGGPEGLKTRENAKICAQK